MTWATCGTVVCRQQGLVIRPFRKAHLTRGTDQELKHLATCVCQASGYSLARAGLDSLYHGPGWWLGHVL